MTTEDQEREASEFARELLMPAAPFSASAKRQQAERRWFCDTDVRALAKEFEVPETEALLRLVALGLIRVKVHRP